MRTERLIAIAIALALAGCKDKAKSDSSDTPAPASPNVAPSTPPPAEALAWYDATRSLYNGIPVTVRFAPKNEASAGEAWAYLQSIDDLFNSYRADSEVGKLNQIAKHDGPVAVSGQMAEALTFSIDLFGKTDGAFDITVAPLMRLWGQAVKDGAPPKAAAIKKTLADVGLAAVTVDKGQMTVDATRRAFDFGGVIKGLAADRAARLLVDAGAVRVFVQVGNETVSIGPSAKNAPTRLAIDNPRDMDALYETIVDPGTGLSATTSTNAKQPRVIGGVTYYHIVDPRTGQPVDVRTLSVTVAFAEPYKAGLADGLATAVAVLGPERGIAVVEAAGGEALVLTAGDDDALVRHESKGWKRLIATP